MRVTCVVRTHARRWGGSFLHMVRSLSHHFSDQSPSRVFLWLDIFSVRPQRASVFADLASSNMIVSLQQLIRGMEKTLVVLDQDGLALKRWEGDGGVYKI